MIISRAVMEAHIRAGRAQRFTREHSPGLILTAASLDGTWFVVMEGTEVYQRASAEFAAFLTVLDSQPQASATSGQDRVGHPDLYLSTAHSPGI
jgi:hypothetical protein